MNTPIIASGINLSALFGDTWAQATDEVTQSAAAAPVEKNEKKIVYLQMQQAIINNDVSSFEQSVKSIGDTLTSKQIYTLGRAILRDFDQRFVDVFPQCQWAELITADTMVNMVTQNNTAGFHFCLNLIKSPEHTKDVVEENFFQRELLEVYQRLSNPTVKNHTVYSAYRHHVAASLESFFVTYIAERFMDHMHFVTPQNITWYQSMMDDAVSFFSLSDIFSGKHPFKVSSHKELFGVTALFQRHPKMFEQFTLWNVEQETKYKNFYAFCEQNVFKVDKDHSDTLANLLSDEFTQYLCERMNIDPTKTYKFDDFVSSKISPHMLLSTLRRNTLSSYALGQYLKDFAQKHEVETNFSYTNVAEQLFENDQEFTLKTLKTPEGMQSVQEYVRDPFGLSKIARIVGQSQTAQYKRLMDQLSHISDRNGNTITHILAQVLSHKDTTQPDIKQRILTCMQHNWEAPNALGQTPKQLFGASEALQEISKEYMQITLTHHLKRKRVEPAQERIKKL